MARKEAGEALDKLQLTKLAKKPELLQKIEALQGGPADGARLRTSGDPSQDGLSKADSVSRPTAPTPTSWEELAETEEAPSRDLVRTEDAPVQALSIETPAASQANENSDDGKTKQIRKLRKQLREIDVLLVQEQRGQELRANQKWKVEKRPEYERRLCELCGNDEPPEPSQVGGASGVGACSSGLDSCKSAAEAMERHEGLRQSTGGYQELSRTLCRHPGRLV